LGRKFEARDSWLLTIADGNLKQITAAHERQWLPRSGIRIPAAEGSVTSPMRTERQEELTMRGYSFVALPKWSMWMTWPSGRGEIEVEEDASEMGLARSRMAR